MLLAITHACIGIDLHQHLWRFQHRNNFITHSFLLKWPKKLSLGSFASFNPISTSSPFFLPLWPRPIDSLVGRERESSSIHLGGVERGERSEGGRERGRDDAKEEKKAESKVDVGMSDRREREGEGVWTPRMTPNSEDCPFCGDVEKLVQSIARGSKFIGQTTEIGKSTNPRSRENEVKKFRSSASCRQ